MGAELEAALAKLWYDLVPVWEREIFEAECKLRQLEMRLSRGDLTVAAEMAETLRIRDDRQGWCLALRDVMDRCRGGEQASIVQTLRPQLSADERELLRRYPVLVEALASSGYVMEEAA